MEREEERLSCSQSFSDDRKFNKSDGFLFGFFLVLIIFLLAPLLRLSPAPFPGSETRSPSPSPFGEVAAGFFCSSFVLARSCCWRTGGKPLYLSLYPHDPQVTTMALRQVPSVTRIKSRSSLLSSLWLLSSFHLRPPVTDDCFRARNSAALRREALRRRVFPRPTERSRKVVPFFPNCNKLPHA